MPAKKRARRNNRKLSSADRKQLYELAIKEGYKPIIGWMDDIAKLEVKIELADQINDTSAEMQFRKLKFDIEKELNSYFFSKLKTQEVQIARGDNSGKITVNLHNPFKELKNVTPKKDS